MNLSSVETLVITLLSLMPTIYQRQTMESILGLLLTATGQDLPEHCQTSSPSAISRFLNQYDWPTRRLIRLVRAWIWSYLAIYSKRGRRPHLKVIIDLTTLEKTGKFKELGEAVRVYNGKKGLHLVFLYLVIDKWRIPWSYRVYRGEGHPSPAALAQRLLRTLPRQLGRTFRVLVLADSAFSSVSFLTCVRRLGFHALVGIGKNRKTVEGYSISSLRGKRGQIRPVGLPFPVSIAHYYFKRHDGVLMKRYLICTRQLKPSTMRWWGKQRWAIEGWFKTVKHRFSLARFGQKTAKGVHRWLILSLLAFLLSFLGYLSGDTTKSPNWGQLARQILELFFPRLLVQTLLQEIERLHPLLQRQGITIQVSHPLLEH